MNYGRGIFFVISSNLYKKKPLRDNSVSGGAWFIPKEIYFSNTILMCLLIFV